MIKHPTRIIWTAVLVASTFDFLFWEKSPGIAFAIFVGIILIAGCYLAWGENQKPARLAGWLLVPIAIFTVGTFVRREPFTTFTNYLLVLILLGVLAHTLRGGRWLNYSLSDFIAAFFYLAVSAVTRPVGIISRSKTKPDEGDEAPTRWQRIYPVIRGLLIAIPTVGLFTALLTSADPIFAEYVEDFVEIFKLENLPEYIFRGVYIFIMGYLLCGIYIHAFTHDKEETLIGEDKPWVPTFLGFTEAAIVLGSIDTLFITFVGVQFRYFFGGQANIKIDGYTYAEYARRGFSELVTVAVISLLLYLGLSTISRRETYRQRSVFSGLGIGLVVLVAVILVSAYQRLLLYEQVYGFTRLRTYSQVFMVWLGILLISVVGLEILKKQRAFALASVLAAVGFVFTLNAINVDQLIVEQNVRRVLRNNMENSEGDAGQRSDDGLDALYLHSLSTDATPALVKAQRDPRLPKPYQDELAAILACQITRLADRSDQKTWGSYHWADARAWQLLKSNRDNFTAARVYEDQYGSWWVMVNGERRPCQYDLFD